VWWSQLLGAGVNPPRQVFAHGWWQVEGDKMSKTLGNVIKPLDVAGKYGRDSLRWHVLREGPAKGDADWRQAAFVARYNSDLANGLGNLVNRSLNMLGKYFEGKVPEEAAFADSALEALRKSLVARVDALYGRLESAVTGFDLDAACEAVMELVREANAFVNASAPFKLAKDPARVVDLRAAMHALCQVDFALCHALRPFVPDAAVRIAAQLGVSLDGSLSERIRWDALKAGHQTGKPEPLFARIEETA
jgi:methionyl-tRNA synthetase